MCYSPMPYPSGTTGAKPPKRIEGLLRVEVDMML